MKDYSNLSTENANYIILRNILHDIYPDFRVRKACACDWLKDSLFVWERETNTEYIFFAWYTGEEEVIEDNKVSKRFKISGYLCKTNQHMWDDYYEQKCYRLYPSID